MLQSSTNVAIISVPKNRNIGQIIDFVPIITTLTGEQDITRKDIEDVMHDLTGRGNNFPMLPENFNACLLVEPQQRSQCPCGASKAAWFPLQGGG